MTRSILEARELCKSYDEGRVQALRGVDLAIGAGEYLAISGPSGSGKSTLLQLLGGLDTPTSGKVLFQNAPLGSAVDLDTYRSRQVGFIFQAFYLLPTLRAFENVQVAMLSVKEDVNHRAARAEALLCEMGLEHRIRHYPNELSAGERQRVAIARALANNPSLLLADEPTGNLDSANGERVMDLLAALNAAGATLVMVTHEPRYAARAKRIVRLFDGQIVAEQECGRSERAAQA
jgi:lipoprotein-releasing system ATP-binding protein